MTILYQNFIVNTLFIDIYATISLREFVFALCLGNGGLQSYRTNPYTHDRQIPSGFLAKWEGAN